MDNTNAFMRSLTLLLAILLITVYIFTSCKTDPVKEYIKNNTTDELSLADYPDKLIEMLRDNPETEDFVLSYPLEKDLEHEIDLSEYRNSDTVPRLLQWDKRWGYEEYGDGMIAFTGCGPVCLSMAAIYLTRDTDITPVYVAELAEAMGYYVDGIGTEWSLMTEGASQLGLTATELPLDKNTVLNRLSNSEPVICAMGPGDFTDKGHFIILSGTENGKIKINDPNSIANSNKLWEFEDISGQIKNLWAFTEV